MSHRESKFIPNTVLLKTTSVSCRTFGPEETEWVFREEDLRSADLRIEVGGAVHSVTDEALCISAHPGVPV